MAQTITIMQDESGIHVITIPLELDDVRTRDILAKALTIVDDTLAQRALQGVVIANERNNE